MKTINRGFGMEFATLTNTEKKAVLLNSFTIAAIIDKLCWVLVILFFYKAGTYLEAKDLLDLILLGTMVGIIPSSYIERIYRSSLRESVSDADLIYVRRSLMMLRFIRVVIFIILLIPFLSVNLNVDQDATMCLMIYLYVGASGLSMIQSEYMMKRANA